MNRHGFTVHKYEVIDAQGEVHNIESRWMFNDNNALIFRHGERGNSRIIAAFAPGHWISVKLVEPEISMADIMEAT
jgi:hypothetical protein